MPKKITVIILGFLLIFYLVLPFKVSSKSTVAKDEENFRVLIQYRAAPKKCTVTTNDQVANFAWGSWKLQSGITDYRINFSTLPSTVSRQTAQAAFDWAFSDIQGAGGGILFHYAGESTETSASNNGTNTLMWRRLPSNIVAVTYIWTDSNNRLSNADTVFNKSFSWSYTGYNGRNDCSGVASRYDLRNVATHEFGHWVGLGDLYDTASKDLTMYGYASRGELKKDSLGLGDTIGVRAVWP